MITLSVLHPMHLGALRTFFVREDEMRCELCAVAVELALATHLVRIARS
jgi:hypothetical protein